MMKALETVPTPSAQGMPAAQRPWYRLHASTYLVLLATATVLFLLNVPGERRESFDGDPGLAPSSSLSVNYRIEHGWPWPYLVRKNRIKAVDASTGDVQWSSLWSFREDFVSFSAWRSAGNLATASAALIAVGLAFEWWRRRRRANWQLTVVDLLALTALLAGIAAYTVAARRVYEEENDLLHTMELTAEQDRQPRVSDELRRIMNCRFHYGGPDWLSDLVAGDRWPKWFNRIVWSAVTPNDLDEAAILRSLRALEVRHIDLHDQHVAALRTLEGLEALSLAVDEEKVNKDAQVATLLAHVSRLQRLETLYVDADAFGDKSARVVSTFPRLRMLVVLSYEHFNDECMAALSRCLSLEVIVVSWTEGVSKRGIQHLSALPNLRMLDLGMSSLGDEAIEELKSLPELEVLRGSFYAMSPAGIERFAELPKIRELAITVGPGGWEGVERLRAVRPDIVIPDVIEE